MWRVPFLAVPQSCFEAPVNAALQAPIKKQEKKNNNMCEISQEADAPLQWPQ